MDKEEYKVVCPFMSMGWLANKWAAQGDGTTFLPNNLPLCLKEKCAIWGIAGCSFSRS